MIPTGTRRLTADLRVARVACTVFAFTASLQPLLIGFFLEGQYPALAYHRMVGLSLIPFGAVAALALLVAAWRRSLPRWTAWLGAALVLSLVGQIITGFTRHASGHLPLGVAIIATAWLLAVRSWRR